MMIPDFDYEIMYHDVADAFRKAVKQKIKKDKKITQSAIGRIMHKSQNAINNWLTENSKYQCLPNAVDFLILCKILELDPGDFIPPSGRVSPSPETPFGIPFVSTSVSLQIKAILNHIPDTPSLNVIETATKNGSTRALLEYVAMYPERAVYLSELSNPEAMLNQLSALLGVPDVGQWLSRHHILILVDHADLLSRGQQEWLAEYFINRQTLVFIRKNFFRNNAFLESGFNRFILPALNRDDLYLISRRVFPGITEAVCGVLEMLARGRLDELLNQLGRLLAYYPGDSVPTVEQAVAALLPPGGGAARRMNE